MDAIAPVVNHSKWNPENCNFSIQQLIQIPTSGFYTLANALIDVPLDLCFKAGRGMTLTEDEVAIFKEVRKIADHAASSIPHGLSAIGTLMGFAKPEDLESEPHIISNLGWFIKDMVLTLDQLNTVVRNCDYNLHEDALLKAALVKKGADNHGE